MENEAVREVAESNDRRFLEIIIAYVQNDSRVSDLQVHSTDRYYYTMVAVAAGVPPLLAFLGPT